jgi:nitroimidazol reductase NimA-like FMN-containing flavoprotein (pyridoxamine 5'-phosphate oxidase superfamily)
MFREIRNFKRQLSMEHIERILKEGEYGVLATFGENGYPYATPISYTYEGNSIYLHCAVEGQKLDNIKHTDRVSFCVVGKTQVLPEAFSTIYESVIVFGKASIVDNEEEKRKALIGLIEKYSKDFMKEGLEYINRAIKKTCIIRIDIEHATAKGRLQ